MGDSGNSGSGSKRDSSSSNEGGVDIDPSGSALQGPLVKKLTIRSRGDKLKDEVTQTLGTRTGIVGLLYTLFPILYWLPHYPIRNYLRGDLISGLTVGVMIVPQAMGYATVAGVPQVNGLYTAMVPIFIYAAMGTSRQLSVGPVAIMSLLVGAVIPTIVTDPTDVTDYVRLATVLALMAGVINATLGALRLGFLVSLLSPGVIVGYMSASSIIIFCTQLKDAFGVTIARTNYFYLNVFWVTQQAWSMNWVSVAFCLLSLTAIYYSQRKSPNVPWPLLVIILDGVIAYLLTTYTTLTPPLIGTIPQGLPPGVIPTCSSAEFAALFPNAIMIALVGFIESISISKKYAEVGGYVLNNSQEFLALGISNIVASFFGAYPATGSFSRTAVKFNTGSQSQISAFIVGLIVIFALLFLTPVLYYIPKAALAAVVMAAVVKLFEYERVWEFWQTSKDDFAIFVVTFFVTLGADVDIGIAVGIGFSLLVILYRAARPHTAQLGNIGGKLAPNYRDVKRNAHAVLEDHTVIARIDATLFFANASYVESKLFKYLNQTEAKRPILYYIIDFTPVNGVDYGATQLLRSVHYQLKKKGVTLVLASVRGHVSEAIVASHLHETIGVDNIFFTVADAVESVKGRLKEAAEKGTLVAFEDPTGEPPIQLKDLFTKDGGRNFKRLFEGIKSPLTRFREWRSRRGGAEGAVPSPTTDTVEMSVNV